MSEEGALIEEMERIAEELDGADLATVLIMIWDDDDSGQEFSDWLDSSRLAKELIHFTQSDPDKAREIIRRVGEIEQTLSKEE